MGRILVLVYRTTDNERLLDSTQAAASWLIAQSSKQHISYAPYAHNRLSCPVRRTYGVSRKLQVGEYSQNLFQSLELMGSFCVG